MIPINVTSALVAFFNVLRPLVQRFGLAAFCCTLFAAVGLPAAHAGNAITWTSLTMASSASPGQSVPINITATNSGTTTWDGNYYIELSDQAGNHLYYPSLATTAPGGSKAVSFSWTMPSTPGTYTYYFKGVQNGVEYFGLQSRTIIITAPPLTVNVSLDSTNTANSQPIMARSTAGPAGQVVYHGLEGRLVGGTWQNWGVWNDTGGTQKTASPTPSVGTYEVRAYAARADAISTYSSSVYLTVSLPTTTLSLDSTTIASGQSTVARSTAGPAGGIVYHGLEGRPVGGTWQNWGVWNDTGGTQKTANPGPTALGTYEVRTYAASNNGVASVSSSLYLTVNPSVNLALDATTLTAGQVTTARSTAGPAGSVVYHGLEGRTVGGTWQNWSLWNDSGGTQKTAAVGPVAGNYEVRAYAAGSSGVSTYSTSVFLTINSGPAVAVNVSLDSTSILAGQSTIVRSTATPSGWIQYHGIELRPSSGGTWQNMLTWNDSGGTQQTASMASLTPAGTYEVRAYAAPANQVASYSASTYLTITTPVSLAFTTQPVNKSVVLPASASFTVAASGNGTLTYQWQRQARGTSTWAGMSNDGTFSGVQTATLSIGTTNTSISQDQFRCVVTDATSATGTSNAARLVVELDPALITLTVINPPLLRDQHFRYQATAAPAAQLFKQGSEYHVTGEPMNVWHWMQNLELGVSVERGEQSGPDWDYIRMFAAGPDNVGYYSALLPVTPRPAKVRLAAKTSSGGWATDVGTFDIANSSSEYWPDSTYRGFLQGTFSAGQTYTLQAWGYAPDANCSQFQGKVYDLAAANDTAALVVSTSTFGSSSSTGQSLTFSPTHDGVYRLNVSYTGATNAINADAVASYDILVGPAPAPSAASDMLISDNRGSGGSPLFQYRIGAAGALSDITYHPSSGTVALTNGFGEKHTDGGFQWVVWADEELTSQDATTLWWVARESGQFNMNQLGTHTFEANQFAPTISAVKNGGNTVWEVYSAGQDQWFPDMNPKMMVKFPCYSRYELLANGVIKVRTVVLVGAMSYSRNSGTQSGTRTSYNASFQMYHDFRAGSATERTNNVAVDAYAYSTDFGFTSGVLGGFWVNDGLDTATPSPNYGHELWYHSQFGGPLAQDSKGYILAFNSRPPYGPALATVFGKQQVVNDAGGAVSGSGLRAQLRWSGAPSFGFTAIPEIGITSLTAGSVLEYTFYLAGETSVTPTYLAMLDSLAANGDGGTYPRPVLYNPAYDFSAKPDLLSVVNKLKDIRDKNIDIWGARTDRVGGLNR